MASPGRKMCVLTALAQRAKWNVLRKDVFPIKDVIMYVTALSNKIVMILN